MSNLHIDIETYSPIDLSSAGVYKYAAHPEFQVLLFAYAFDDVPVQVVDLACGEQLPGEVINALSAAEVTKKAYNAIFEMTCLSAAGIVKNLDIAQWECTMVHSAMAGFPFGLDAAATVAGIESKMQGGKALIRYFCMPCVPTRANGERSRNLPRHDVQKWTLFKSYCAQDVDVERNLEKMLPNYSIDSVERLLWRIDHKINSKGVRVDAQLVSSAIKMDQEHKEKLGAEAQHVTGLDNPNSVSQLKAWLEDELGEEVLSLNKKSLPDLISNAPMHVKRMIELRQSLAKTSIAKYKAMEDAMGTDGRVRGMLQFYGANRTGRWAGRLVQLHNLPQNHIKELDLAREVVRSGDADLLSMLYSDQSMILSQLVRTAFIPSEGCIFYIADFSAIEARVLAWIAGETWRQDVFATHGKIYEASAAAMFHVPIDQVTKGSELRQKGKVAELACGYGGGVGALKAMGAGDMDDIELQAIIDKWRSANKAIVKFWASVENAANMVLFRNAATAHVGVGNSCTFKMVGNDMRIVLPSGRELAYKDATVCEVKGRRGITYMGMNQTTRKWERATTYGGKLTENIIQAIARDCLRDAIISLYKSNREIVMHVHDEIIIEGKERKGELEEICKIMGAPISWAPELQLRADGFISNYYKKD